MSQLPTQIYEVVPLVDGTVLVRVYVPTLVQGGGYQYRPGPYLGSRLLLPQRYQYGQCT